MNNEAPTAPARIAAVHVADVVPNSLFGADSWRTPDFTDDATFVRLYSRHQRATCTWTVSFIGPDGACRRVQGGPVESGPYAFLTPHATVISRVRVPGDAAATVDLAEGDLVIVRGVAFRIDDTHGRRGDNPRLVPVTG